ncbi:hypothetical protein BJ170DRAFT_681645 [Xylariales sp. AK1849]|nr:hypothetical protein BJ170DRAFT_681645 [Xylariales sp. AK1849]
MPNSPEDLKHLALRGKDAEPWICLSHVRSDAECGAALLLSSDVLDIDITDDEIKNGLYGPFFLFSHASDYASCDCINFNYGGLGSEDIITALWMSKEYALHLSKLDTKFAPLVHFKAIWDEVLLRVLDPDARGSLENRHSSFKDSDDFLDAGKFVFRYLDPSSKPRTGGAAYRGQLGQGVINISREELQRICIANPNQDPDTDHLFEWSRKVRMRFVSSFPRDGGSVAKDDDNRFIARLDSLLRTSYSIGPTQRTFPSPDTTMPKRISVARRKRPAIDINKRPPWKPAG